MNRFKISTRVAALAGILSLLLLAIGSLGLWGIGRSNDAMHSIYGGLTTTAQVSEIQVDLVRNRLAIMSGLMTTDVLTIQASANEVESNIKTINSIWDAYMAKPHAPEEARIASRFAENRKRFVQEGLLPAIAALRANDAATVSRLTVEAIEPLYVPVSADIDALVKLQADEGKKSYENADTRYAAIRAGSIASIIAGLLFAAMFAMALVRGISRSLGQAIHAAEAIAKGDLSQTIEEQGQDEAAQVLHALAGMQKQLTGIVTSIRAGSESVASASGQIFNGNRDLSGRTEQQASALEQTAAAMEQLNATVQQNADSSRQAQQLAANASMVAVKGGDVMGQVVTTMRDIHTSSGKIADIIGVIDSIAFQTNILALNAAVEAARAGEEGRGFAVVASEVRNLAKRSADAAKEIKELINSSVERVGQGTALVNTAGATMQEAVTAIQRVTTLMTDISSASVEQSSGMAQIGTAVQHLDQTTQQNASLVEELSAAARSLQEQAQNQVQTISVFTLANDAGGHHGSHAALEHSVQAKQRLLPTTAT